MTRLLRHYLRNFASAVKAATTVLSEQLAPKCTPGEMEYFPLISAECDALVRVTERLTLLAEGPAKDGPSSVGTALEQAVVNIGRSYPTARLRVDADPKAVSAVVQKGASLAAAVVEIAVNAIEAASAGETVIRVSCASGSVDISVRDSGKGMNQETWTGMLRPFETSKLNRLGIGLSIAGKLVSGMDGKLCAAGCEGGFVVTIGVPTVGQEQAAQS